MTRLALYVALAVVAGQPPQPPRYGPWHRDLALQESADGLRFGPPTPFVERAGVPSLCRDRGGRLLAVFQWFPFDRREAFDKVAAVTSDDDGRTWTKPQSIAIRALPAGYERPYDPTLVRLDDGRLRIYFTSRDARDRGPQAIYSAVSPDGLSYEFEPGRRFAVEDDQRRAFDCAVAKLGPTWHLYCPVPARNGRGYHGTSADGLAFRREPDVLIPGDRQWLGNVVAVGDRLRFYGSGREMWIGTSGDGSTWEVEAGDRQRGGDPAVVQTKAGRWLRVYTGELRADADDVRPPFAPRPTP